MARPKARLIVSPSERKTLERWTRRRKTARALALRARIILLSAKGWHNGEVAEDLGVSRQMLGRWRQRFIDKRLDGLLDEPRPGAPRRITDADLERVVLKTLESTPRGATHWSTRSMARESGLSQTAVTRIWHVFGLQPHPSETFKLSSEPLFIEKVRDVVGLYLHPPDRAVMLCVSASTRSRRSRHWIVLSRCSRCDRVR